MFVDLAAAHFDNRPRLDNPPSIWSIVVGDGAARSNGHATMPTFDNLTSLDFATASPVLGMPVWWPNITIDLVAVDLVASPPEQIRDARVDFPRHRVRAEFLRMWGGLPERLRPADPPYDAAAGYPLLLPPTPPRTPAPAWTRVRPPLVGRAT